MNAHAALPSEVAAIDGLSAWLDEQYRKLLDRYIIHVPDDRLETAYVYRKTGDDKLTYIGDYDDKCQAENRIAARIEDKIRGMEQWLLAGNRSGRI